MATKRFIPCAVLVLLSLTPLRAQPSAASGNPPLRDMALVPYFRGASGVGPEFYVSYRNGGDMPISYQILFNSSFIELDGHRYPRIPTFANMPDIEPGGMGQDVVPLFEFYLHRSGRPLARGLHTLVFECGGVRSAPLRFYWAGNLIPGSLPHPAQP